MSTSAPPEARPVLTLPTRRTGVPRTALGRWLLQDHRHGEHATHPWYQVLWLTGVDYFSTLGYQPGIALLAAGALSPLATLILVGVTLLGALPVYSQVAVRSYAGQGSIAMLENLLPGWGGKLFVLAMLGFAGTDFVITMTLSAADAAEHAIKNPYLHPYLGEAQVALTIGFLAVLALVFLRGFREAIGVAAGVAVPYLLLNAVVLVRGLVEIAHHEELLPHWRAALAARGDWTALLVASALVFPRLALGMSGFETGVSVMPVIHRAGRIRSTRKLLASAALIMSVLLIGSSFVTALLVPEGAYLEGGEAAGRAIAFLAHRYLGPAFGTVYDLATILILWFAGASAMAGLLNLVPRYLPRFGMAPRWVARHRPLVLVLFLIAVIVTLVFQASVEKQSGAYATGVLALMLSAAIAVALALKREKASLGRQGYFWLVSAVFAYTLGDNVITRPDGVIISSVFILGVMTLSGLSRWRRATELRVAEVRFVDAGSEGLWPKLVGKKVNVVPLRTSTPEARQRKAAEIRRHYAATGPIAFTHVNLLDNRSEFLAPLEIKVTVEGQNYVVEVSGAVAIANTIAYVSELIDPISIFLGLTRRNLMEQALRYLLWGEGETGLMVYTILVRYWEWTPEEDVRPLIFLMSE
jgi:hypothetical protein